MTSMVIYFMNIYTKIGYNLSALILNPFFLSPRHPDLTGEGYNLSHAALPRSHAGIAAGGGEV
ncbi:hypothetical protein U9M48_004130 [Paspalum notatum var. saurae]|uniref:Uncharacterized protein n=1 Tax=Paspalum notatum var. saurae TaxID=547442 RepID=A0AAQ3SL53_PASNO